MKFNTGSDLLEYICKKLAEKGELATDANIIKIERCK